MSDLTWLARIEHIRSDAESRAATALKSIPYDNLVDFASELLTDHDLSGWVIPGSGTVDELLRALAYNTCVREACRRAEVAELEDDGA